MPMARAATAAPPSLPLCAGCRQRDTRIAELDRQVARLNVRLDQRVTQLQRERDQYKRLLPQRDRRIAQLQERIRNLTARTKPNASNSSTPPSANPPDAPKPVVKKPTGRKPGGQPGHPGHSRQRLPAERVQHTIPIVPDACEHCHAKLPAQAGPNDPAPDWHQFAELPRMAAVVTEYQAHARTCTKCGIITRATIPDELRSHAIGTRLAATLNYLTACPHVSKRGVEEVVETVLQVPIALGTVSNLEREMSAALQPAHAEAQAAVQQAPIKNLDETGWKKHRDKRWLWAASTTSVVCFLIHAKRNLAALRALLGGKLKGIFCTDRWNVYNRIPVNRRQICWAHLKRDFQKLVDLGGDAKPIGEQGLATAAILFDWWQTFRGGGCSRRQLRSELEPIREAAKEWLEEGTRSSSTKAAALCQNLLNLEPAMWLFLYRRGVEPTNNHIERLQRLAVLWRKISFGCHSDAGCRFVERILTVVQTLRLQKRPVLDFLEKSLQAHREGTPPPKLLGGD